MCGRKKDQSLSSKGHGSQCQGLDQKLANFSQKSQMATILGVSGHMVSAVTI